MVSRATDIQVTHRWESDPFGRVRVSWPEFIRSHRGAFGFALAAIVLLTGWINRDRNWTSADHGLGYALGFISLGCMLVLLVYPLRKRFRTLKFIGPLPKWFRNHMILGVAAPIAALYHCNFEGGSLNSRIALFSSLTVATSGLIGRFIHSKVHRGLYGRKSTLKELLARVKVSTPGVGKLGATIPELMVRMTQFDRDVLVPPANIFECVKLPFVLAFKTRIQSLRLRRFVRLNLAYQARHSAVINEHRDRLERSFHDYIRNHLRQVRRVAEFVAYERLLALWHRVHVPFFMLLTVSVTVHLAVVYLY